MRNLSFFAAAFMSAISACSVAFERATEAIGSFILAMLRVIAHPPQHPVNGRDNSNEFGWSALAYDGPDMDLRHEAGTARVKAARHI